MSLTQQFLIISILPLSFLGMIWHLHRSDLQRRVLLHRWTLALLAAAVWASSVLRFYGGMTFPLAVAFTWGVVGKYAFTVTAVAILLTTFSHLSIPRRHGRFALGLSGALGLLALLLDYEIWPQFPDFILAGQTIRHFDLSVSVWIASWLVPILAAWILARQVQTSFPNSLYRNQTHYWLLVLVLFMIGGGLASVRQPGQPVWQEGGLLIIILASLTGTISITHSHLPDLQVSLRQLLSRLSGSLIIFGLTWLALSVIVRGVTDLPADSSPNLLLVLAAAFFAGFFTFIYRLVNEMTRRLFLPGLTRREAALLNYSDSIGNLPEPVQLAQLFLRVIQSDLGTDDAWFFATEDGPAGSLMLRPLSSLGDFPSEAASFDGDSLFTAYLRQNHVPLVQYDIDTLSSFDAMTAEEKAVLAHWGRVLYMPLHAGNSLTGVLALGEKATGESYDRQDFERLQFLAPQISPLLAQAQNMAGLRRVNDYVFAQNQILTHEKRQLRERLNLYGQYAQLISPELRRPFISIRQQIEKLQTSLAEPAQTRQLTDDLSQQIERLRTTIEQMITVSDRLQRREDVNFQPADLDAITQQAIRGLKTMAEARRVHIEYDPAATLPPVLGDSGQLQEAIHHLLHNAIKFNKIGGSVQLNYAVAGDHICLHMGDTGVGIPKERLETLWQGLSDFGRTSNGRPGLGLTLTRYIIAAHGGYVEVESKYGSGSIFSIYLPVADDENG